jgi:hypothetical protein
MYRDIIDNEAVPELVEGRLPAFLIFENLAKSNSRETLAHERASGFGRVVANSLHPRPLLDCSKMEGVQDFQDVLG